MRVHIDGQHGLAAVHRARRIGQPGVIDTLIHAVHAVGQRIRRAGRARDQLLAGADVPIPLDGGSGHAAVGPLDHDERRRPMINDDAIGRLNAIRARRHGLLTV